MAKKARIWRTILGAILLLFIATTVGASVLLDENFDDGTADDLASYDELWWVEPGIYRCYTLGFEILSFSTAGDAMMAITPMT